MNIINLIQLARKHYIEGNLVQAEHVYRKILKKYPNNAGAYYELANVFQDKGQLNEAILYYKKAINIDPQFSGSYNNLGNVLRKDNQFREAICYYEKAITLAPNFAGSYYNLAQAMHDNGQFQEAITYYRRALQIDPNLGNAYYNLGNVFRETGQLQEALNCYHKALQISPNSIYAYNNLGNVLRETGQLQEALNCYHKALQINPLFADTYGNFANVLVDQGRLNEAEDSYRRALQIKPDFFAVYSNLLMLINYSSRYDARTIASEHLRFGKHVIEQLSLTTITHNNKRIPDRNLRIGYVSPDFRRHPVASFIEPVIAAHNRKNFEVFCYSNSSRHDETTERIQEYAHQWRDILRMSDQQATELIRNDEIDILVDLAGHTAGNRILLFARKPAPIQISWIGYLATTGLSTMDYKIVDNYTDPPGKTEQFHTENLIRLPESFLCYLPDKESPEVGPLPALSTGHITFGSFNNFAKVTSEVVTLWAEILNELPDSHLLLKGKSFHDKATCQYAINMFTQRGIAAERITLQPSDPSPKHLESYNLVDIGLDTFPFNGAATTCEAMWMGVPVITLAGTAYHSSVGISLLSNVGITELIAKMPDEYVEIAVNLAKDLKKLKALREHLRDMIKNSPLCDSTRFTANLEMCYRKIWKTWCEDASLNR